MARDEIAVLRRDQIRLDVVRAELDRERVALQRVRGQVAMGAAVPDDERLVLVFFPVIRFPRIAWRCRNGAQHRRREQAARDIADSHYSSRS